jgi:FkbM family methyltransferase
VDRYYYGVYLEFGARSIGAPGGSFPEFLSLYEDELLPWFSLCHPEDILSNVTGIVAASELWADCRSREEFRAQVDFRLTFCSSELPSHERASDIYFPPDLVRPRADDVFVDCGACAGETTAQFIRQWNPSCHQVIAIEPDPENFSRLTETITLMSKAEAGRIRTVQAGLASRRSVEHFQVMGNVTSKICAEGTPILCQPLDDILGDSVPTYIKMDIEGAEAEALKGASRTIRQHKPSLAVCLYHRYDDLWNIPLLIKQIEPAYRLYLRRYSDECWEQVLYAVPASFANGRES